MTKMDALWMNRVVVRMMNEIENQLKKAGITNYMQFNQAEMEKGIRFLLLFLREALLLGKPEIFVDNVSWFHRNRLNQSLPPFVLEETIGILKAIVSEEESPDFRARVVPLLEDGLAHIADGVPVRDTYLDQPGVDTAGCKRYLDSLLCFKPEDARKTVHAMMRQGLDVRRIYSMLFQPILYEIGRLWQTGEVSVAQEHYVTETTRSIMDSVLPAATRMPDKAYSFLGLCVENEQHSIGIRMVCDHFALGGWHSHYLGGNVPCSGILEMLKRMKVDLIGISVAMPYNIHKAAENIECIRSTEAGTGLVILAGGIAFNDYPDLWVKVGADGYAGTAEEAYAKGMMMVEQSRNARGKHE